VTPPTWLFFPATGAPHAAPFAPGDLTSLVGWWDADAASTLFDATSGGNLVTTHNAQVKRWEDKSGKGHHATQNNTNGPKIQTTSNTLNSKPVMRFAATSSSWLVVPWSTDFNPTPLTVMVVIRTTETNTNRGPIGSGAVGSSWFLIHRRATAGNTPTAGLRNGADTDNFIAQAPSVQVNDGAGHLLGQSMDPPSGNLELWVDGIGEASVSATSSRASDNDLNIGTYAVNQNQNTFGLTGDLAEVVIFQSVDNNDRQRVEGYLAHKWGITGVLDTNHPYKTTPP
jgi:hypothetical protein